MNSWLHLPLSAQSAALGALLWSVGICYCGAWGSVTVGHGDLLLWGLVHI